MKNRIEKKTANRLQVLLGAATVELCLGMMSSGGAFRAGLCEKSARDAWTLSQADGISMLTLSCFIVFVVLSVFIRERFRPEKVLLAGGLSMGAGCLLSAFFGNAYAAHLIGIGLLSGAGAGLAFLVPFITVARLFPDRKGLALGLTASGFGIGPVVGSGAAEAGASLHLGGLGGVQSVYLLSGVFFIVVFTACRNLFRDPEAFSDRRISQTGGFASAELRQELSILMKNGTFCLTAVVFFLSAAAGCLMMKYIGPFGTQVLNAAGMEMKLAVKVAELSAFVASILLAAGCVFWGMAYDQGGRRLAVILMCAAQGAVALLYPHAARSPQSVLLFSSAAGCLAGGNYVLFMLFSGDRFGEENMGTAYALQFPAFGIAALAAPQAARYLRETALQGGDSGAWALPFYAAGAACFLGAAIMMWVNKAGSKWRIRRRSGGEGFGRKD